MSGSNSQKGGTHRGASLADAEVGRDPANMTRLHQFRLPSPRAHRRILHAALTNSVRRLASLRARTRVEAVGERMRVNGGRNSRNGSGRAEASLLTLVFPSAFVQLMRHAAIANSAAVLQYASFEIVGETSTSRLVDGCTGEFGGDFTARLAEVASFMSFIRFIWYSRLSREMIEMNRGWRKFVQDTASLRMQRKDPRVAYGEFFAASMRQIYVAYLLYIGITQIYLCAM